MRHTCLQQQRYRVGGADFERSADWTTSGLFSSLWLTCHASLLAAAQPWPSATQALLISINWRLLHRQLPLLHSTGVTSNTTISSSARTPSRCNAPATVAESSIDVSVYDSSVAAWSPDVLPFAFDSEMIITSVTPSQLYFPGLTVLTVRGSSFPSLATDLYCLLSGSVAVPASFISSNAVTCLSPELPPGLYSIEVSYSQSIDYSRSGVSVQYMLSQPSVAAISPTTAPIATSVTITLTGANFIASASLACLFDQQQLSAHYVNSNTITCLLPAQSTAGVYPVSVTLNGVEWTSQAISITLVSLPFVSSVSPASGPVSGGTVVTISGLLFSSDAVVHFGSVVVTPSYIDSMTLQAVAPAVAGPTSVSVEVAVAGGVSTTDHVQFVYVASVQLTQLSPTTALETGGDTLLVYSNSSFVSTAALQCVIMPPSAGAVLLSATFISPSLLSCVAPASVNGLGVGSVSVSNNGLDWSGALTFTYVSPAFLLSLSPTIVPSLAAFSLTVSGSGFSGVQLDTCVVDGVPFAANVSASSDSVVVCWIGVALPAGTVNVSLTSTAFNPHTAYSQSQPRVYSPSTLQLQVVATPAVLSLFPTAGSSAGGTLLTVQGINFDLVNGMQCVFGSSPPFIAYTTATPQSGTQLTCPTPASPTHSSGPVVVQLRSAALSSIAVLNETNKHFTYYKPFSIAAAFPLSLPAYTASTITVIGTGFPDTPALMAIFGSTLPSLPAPSAVSDLSSVYSGLGALGYVSCVTLNSSWLECPTPAIDLPFSTAVRLTANLVDFSAAVPLTLYALPAVLAVTPTLGPTVGGTLLTIEGSGFQSTSTLVCSFGSIVHSATYISPLLVTCITPPMPNATQLAVYVSLDGQQWSPAGAPFTWYASPLLLSLFPSHVLTMGDSLLLVRGDNFVQSVPLVCSFNGVPYDEAIYINPTAVVCITPPLSMLGVAVIGTASSWPVPVELSMNGVDWSVSQLQLWYDEESHVTAVVPASQVDSSVGQAVVVAGGVFQPSPFLSCLFGSVAVSAVWLNTSAVSCTPPAATSLAPVLVSVSTDAVGSYTTDLLYFTYVATPAIASISPTALSTRSVASQLTVTGDNFLDPVWCVFNGSLRTAAKLVDLQTVTCLTPASGSNATSSFTLSLSFPSLQFITNSLTVGFSSPPAGLTVLPTHVPASGGTSITVQGSGMAAGNTFCRFSAAVSTVIAAAVSSATQCTCTTPLQLSVGILNVSVVDATGTTSASHVSTLVVDATAAVSAVRPALVTVIGGASLTVTGSNFVNGPHLLCLINGVISTATFLSNTSLVCVSPTLPALGSYGVEVSNNGQDFTHSGVSFSYTAEMTIAVPYPSAQWTSSNAAVTVSGSNFVNSADLLCSYGSVALPGRYVDSSHVLCLTPAMANLSVNATLPLQLFFNEAQLVSSALPYQAMAVPYTLQLQPTCGPFNGGTVLTVTGGSFSSFSPLYCLFNGTVLTAATFVSSNSVNCTSPASTASSPASVTVQVVYGASSVAGPSAVFTYLQPIQVSGVAPAVVSELGGQLLTLTSNNSAFVSLPSLACLFSQPSSGLHQSLPASFLSSGAVQCVSPAAVSSLGWLRVRVTNNGVDWSNAVTVTYRETMALLSLSPSVGGVDGGSAVSVLGSNFLTWPVSDVWCMFGSLAVPATVVNSSALVCHTPAQSNGSVSVSLADGNANALTTLPVLSFTYSTRPAVLSLAPSIGPSTGGTIISLTIANASTALSSSLSCVFTSSSTSVTVAASQLNSTTVSCISPRAVLLSGGTAASNVTVEVGWPGLLSTSGLSFTFVNVSLYAVEPRVTLSTGGVNVTVTGSGFVNYPSLACLFNGSHLVPAVLLSGSGLTCTLPSLAVGSVGVEVVMNGQQSTASGLALMTVVSPSITSSSPVSGPNAGFTRLTVTGSGFSNTSGLYCRFSSGAAQPASYVNNSALTCLTPPAPSSQPGISLTLQLSLYANPVASAPQTFTYYAADPIVTAIQPDSGQWAGWTRLTLSGLHFPSVSSPLSFCRFIFDSELSSFHRVALPAYVDTVLTLSLGVWSCLSPALPQPRQDTSAVYRVEVGFNGQDVTGQRLPFVYVPSPQLTSVTPVRASTAGSTVVTVSGSWFTTATLLFASPSFELQCVWMSSSATVMTLASVLNDTLLTCAAPSASALSAFRVNLTLTFNGQDLSTSTPLLFTYYAQLSLTALLPPFARHPGGSVLTVSGVGFINSSSLSCLIDGELIVATFLSSTQLTCVVPPAPSPYSSYSQTVLVRVSNIGSFIDASNALTLPYYPPAVVTSLSPTISWTAGGVSIQIAGMNLVNSSLAYCLFDSISTPATALICPSPPLCTLISCLTPAHPAGVASVTVTGSGQDVSAPPVALLFFADPVLVALSPAEGVYLGGTTITVTATGLFNASTWVCRFNGSVVVAAVIVSGYLQCVTPAWPTYPAMVAVDISEDGTHFFNQSLPFSYINQTVLSVIQPPQGPTSGNTLVTLLGAYTAASLSSLECLFGSIASPVLFSNMSLLQCLTPAVTTAGTVNVSIVSGSSALTLMPVQFVYYQQATTVDVQPRSGSVEGGTKVVITGSGFVNNGLVACQFNGSSVTATFIASTMIECVVPASTSGSTGPVVVTVSNNAQDYFAVQPLFTYTSGLSFRRLWPTNGDCDGGTAVYVYGSGFTDASAFSIGIDGYTAGCSTVNATMLRCSSPAVYCSSISEPVSTSVSISSNGQDYYDSMLSFTYTQPVSISSVSPASGVMRGFTPVTMAGSGFLNSSALSCRFDQNGSYVVPASYQSSDSVVCITPAHVNASVVLEVANNEADWVAAVSLFTYQLTQPGYYVDGYTLTACPSGSYCNGDPLATNYTLCIPGSFQPSSGQSACLPCPRGSYCPYMGMSAALTCPAGYVCPTASMQAATVYCPSGYYCPNGTLTSVGILNEQPPPAEYGSLSLDGWDVSLLYRIDGLEYYSNQTQTVGSSEYYVNWTDGNQTAVDLYRDAAIRVRTAGINPTGSSRPSYWTNAANHAGVLQMYFTAFDGVYRNVWKSDSTDAGTVPLSANNGVGIVAGFVPSPDTAAGDNPLLLGMVGTVLMFSAADSAYGVQLWYYDTYQDGGIAHRVPTNLPTSNAVPIYLASTSAHVYFSLDNGATTELWRGNATWAELVRSLSVASYIASLYGDLLFFSVDGSLPGCELWVVDAADLSFVVQLTDVSALGSEQLAYIDTAYFSFEGDLIGTADTVANETALYGRIYLSAVNYAKVASSPSASTQYPFDLTDVWESDGTTQGTIPLSARPYPCYAGFYCAPGSSTGYSAVDESDYDVLDTVASQLFGVQDLTTSSPRRRLLAAGNDPTYCLPTDTACVQALALVNVTDALTLNSTTAPVEQPLLWTAMPCLDGFLCPPASTSPHGSGQCPAGYYCTHGLSVACPPASHCAEYGSFYPTLCPPGTYNSFSGQSQCQPCSLGYHCPNFGLSLPRPCEAGRVCDEVGMVLGKLCPPGLYCLAYTISTDPNSTTVALYGGQTGQPAVLCPPGAFCLGGVQSANVTDGDMDFPQSCTPGFYCVLGASSPEGTAICPKGAYCPRGSTEPIPTEPGYFSYTEGAQAPSECLPGTWAPYPSMVQCLVCPAGYECPDSATSNTSLSFQPCIAGYFRPALESYVTCQPCPEGTWSNVTELGTEDGCHLCVAEYVCAEAGRTVPPDESNAEFPLSSLCPDGYVCSAGTNTSTEKDVLCPAGYYCPSGTTNDTQYDSMCAAGFFCPPGSTNTTANENICPAGYFCPAGTTDSPLYIRNDACPVGTTSDPGATSALECYKTCRYSSVDACVVVAHTNALPGNNTALVLDALGYSVVVFDFSTVYANPFAQELQYNDHFRISVYAGSVRQNMSYYFDSLTGQPRLITMGLTAMVATQLIVQIDILHGYYVTAVSLFSGVANYTTHYPNRAYYGGVVQFLALVTEADTSTAGVEMPLNIIENDQLTVLIDDVNPNATFDQIMDTTITAESASYWRLATYAQKASGIVTLPFLPFFSSCEGYDAHVPLSTIFEEPDQCDLVDPDRTVPITNFGISISPVSDTCDRSIQCTYEETMALSSTTRWFELSAGSTMFYLTTQPWGQADFTSPSASTFLSLVGGAGAIPVTVVTDLLLNTTQMQIPRTVILDIGYYQMTQYDKQIVTATVNFTDIIPIPSSYSASVDATLHERPGATATNGTRLNQYTLIIRYHPLSWLDLLNNFILPTAVYTVVFLIIGAATVFIMATFWLINRLSSKNKQVPNFRFWTFAQIIIPPPLQGGFLATLTVVTPVALIMMLLHYLYPVAWQNTTGNYSDILSLTDTRVEFYRIGRLGAMFCFLGLMLVWVGSCLFVPDRDVVGKTSDMWRPRMWKRCHMMLVSVMMAVFLSVVLQISYSPFFARNIYASTVAFKMLQAGLDIVVTWVMGEWLTSSPLMVAMMVVQYVISMGAAIFEEFLLSYFILFMTLIVERVYIDPYLKTAAHKLPLYYARLQLRLYQQAGYSNKAQLQQERILALTEEMGTQTIEPMLNSLVLYANETTALLMNPFVVLFILGFATETGIPANYSINAQDLQYYLLFCLLIIAPQFVGDCFLMNTIEIYHLYPIFDYMEFARYRFKTRQQSWKADEPNVDETLHPRHQSIDQLCFSSQYYFMTALHNWGILLLVMGITIMYGQQYNPFGDSLMPLLFFLALFTTIIARKLAATVADKLSLWAKQSDSDSALVRRRLAEKKEETGLITKRKSLTGWLTSRSTAAAGELTRRQAVNKRISVLRNMFVKHHNFDIRNERDGWYRSVPQSVMQGEEMKRRFVALNGGWLMRQLPNIMDAAMVERYKSYLTEEVAAAIEQRKERRKRIRQVALAKKNAAAARSANPQPTAPRTKANRVRAHQPNRYTPKLCVAAVRWLHRARRTLRMLALVADIKAREVQPLCCQCSRDELLEVEEFIDPRELLRQFDAQLALDCEGWSAELVEQYVLHNWRPFYYSNQHFRTRCVPCLAAEQQLLMRQPVDVSDDEDDKHEHDDGRGVLWSSAVMRVALRLKDKLWKRVLHRRARAPLAPVRLRGRTMKRQTEQTREAEEAKERRDEEQEEDEREEDEEKKKQYRVRPQLDDPTAISSDDDDDDHIDRNGQQRVAREGHGMTRGSVQLTQSGDQTRYHFQANPSRRVHHISDDSDSDEEEKKLPFTGYLRDDISDDSEDEEDRRARDSVISVGEHPKLVRQYSDFGLHRHEHKPHVSMLPSPISDDDEEMDDDESKDELGRIPRRLPYAVPELDSGVLSAVSSQESSTASRQQPHVIFSGRRPAVESDESSRAVSPRSASSSRSQFFLASPRGRGPGRVSPIASIRGRSLPRGVSSPSSASVSRFTPSTPRGGSAGLIARRGGRLRPIVGAGRGNSSSAAARTAAAAVPIYGQRVLGRGASGASRRARGGGGRRRGAGALSDGDSQPASPPPAVHLLNPLSPGSAAERNQWTAVERPISPDSDEFDTVDDDAWQR